MRLVPSDAVARRWDFDPKDVLRLEAAHAGMLEAADRADRRLARKRDRQRLAEAEAAERAILSWMGVDSWVDYRLRAAGVVELDDILAVVDLTKPQADRREDSNERELAVWRRGRPLVRQAKR